MEKYISKSGLHSSRLKRYKVDSTQDPTPWSLKSPKGNSLNCTLLDSNPSTIFNLKSINNTKTVTPTPEKQKSRTKTQKTSTFKLKQYLDMMKGEYTTKIDIKHRASRLGTWTPNKISLIMDQTKSQQQMIQKKRLVKTIIPYTDIAALVEKIYKNYETIFKLGFSKDQVAMMIRQVCARRKNLEVLLLNKKQKPKRSYFTYQIKSQEESRQTIIKESFENRNGKFDCIFRDLRNFCSYFQQQIIERGRNRIKEIKKSIVHLKSEIEENQFCSELGFNNFMSDNSKKPTKICRSRPICQDEKIRQYMSTLSKNIDDQLVDIQSQMGEFLDENRNFVCFLSKIQKKINK